LLLWSMAHATQLEIFSLTVTAKQNKINVKNRFQNDILFYNFTSKESSVSRIVSVDIDPLKSTN
jgi:hypothetical protein